MGPSILVLHHVHLWHFTRPLCHRHWLKQLGLLSCTIDSELRGIVRSSVMLLPINYDRARAWNAHMRLLTTAASKNTASIHGQSIHLLNVHELTVLVNIGAQTTLLTLLDLGILSVSLVIIKLALCNLSTCDATKRCSFLSISVSSMLRLTHRRPVLLLHLVV